MMKIIKMTEGEMSDHLGNPFNPPIIDSEFSEERFSEEWWFVRNQFENLLGRFGENDAYGQKDFNLGETVTLSRGIGVELTSDRMINADLIPETQRFLKSLPQEYEIDFSLITEDGFFDVFVSKNTVRHDCPSALIERLV